MSMTWGEADDLEKIRKATKKSVDLQEDLIKAFNANTRAIERQNELQEKTLEALEQIAKNTAPRIKIIPQEPKKALNK